MFKLGILIHWKRKKKASLILSQRKKKKEKKNWSTGMFATKGKNENAQM